MALTDNLVSYWKFDESSGNAADTVGTNTLTNNNSITYDPGLINNEAGFSSGSSMYFSNAAESGLPSGGDARTINIWTRTTNDNKLQGLFFYGTATPNDMVAIYLDSRNGIELLQVNGNGADYTPSFTWSANTRYMVTAIYTGTEVHAYVNASELGAGSALTWTTASGTALNLGRAEGGNYLDGNIDETGVWARALSAAEITELYNAGAGLAYPFSGAAASHFLLMGV